MQHLLAALKQVKRLGSNDKKMFLKSCNKDFIQGLCECIRNMMNGRVFLKPCQLKCLSRHKQTLRKLALKKTSMTHRKKWLQKVGFFQFLLGPLISGLGSLLVNALSPNNAAR